MATKPTLSFLRADFCQREPVDNGRLDPSLRGTDAEQAGLDDPKESTAGVRETREGICPGRVILD